jgi:hypothetical protein
MTADYVAELVQDARAELTVARLSAPLPIVTVSAVGLYEFIWALRGFGPTQSLDVMREQASAALKRLLADGDTWFY